jgi:hypothetical protein
VLSPSVYEVWITNNGGGTISQENYDCDHMGVTLLRQEASGPGGQPYMKDYRKYNLYSEPPVTSPGGRTARRVCAYLRHP